MDPRRNERGGLGRLQPQPATARGAAPDASAQRRTPAAISDALELVDRELRQLRIEFEKFFNGALHVPPEELRTKVQNSLRNLRNFNLGSVENFRLADLESRYNSYNELFNRRIREQEEGRRLGMRAAAPPPAPRLDVARGVVVGSSLEPSAVTALYEGLAQGPGDGPRFDLESFRAYLAKQVAAIQQKTGCAEVQFRLASEDGKLKLKARPL